MKYNIYRTDGSVSALEADKELTLEQMYKIIGCDLIEFTPGDRFGYPGLTCCVDEEGLCKADPEINPWFVKRDGNGSVVDGLAGTVIVGRDIHTKNGTFFRGV